MTRTLRQLPGILRHNYRVEVNAFGNAFNVEKRIGNSWLPVIRWLGIEQAEVWQRRLHHVVRLRFKLRARRCRKRVFPQ